MFGTIASKKISSILTVVKINYQVSFIDLTFKPATPGNVGVGPVQNLFTLNCNGNCENVVVETASFSNASNGRQSTSEVVILSFMVSFQCSSLS